MVCMASHHRFPCWWLWGLMPGHASSRARGPQTLWPTHPCYRSLRKRRHGLEPSMQQQKTPQHPSGHCWDTYPWGLSQHSQLSLSTSQSRQGKWRKENTFFPSPHLNLQAPNSMHSGRVQLPSQSCHPRSQDTEALTTASTAAQQRGELKKFLMRKISQARVNDKMCFLWIPALPLFLRLGL